MNDDNDEMVVADTPVGRWMTIPLAPDEASILRGLPERGKREFEENVHRYIKQVGDDYQVTPKPTQENTTVTPLWDDREVLRCARQMATKIDLDVYDVAPAQEAVGMISKERAIQMAEERIKQYAISPSEAYYRELQKVLEQLGRQIVGSG